MLICPCGGKVSQAELTSGRERRNCADCGRYEIFLNTPLTNLQNAYNADMDNRKAHDKTSVRCKSISQGPDLLDNQRR